MAYFPNGTSGDVLDRQCETCPVGIDPDAPCPVLLAQLEWNYGQFKEDGKRTDVSQVLDILINDDGICQMRKVMKETFEKDKPQPQCVADYDSVEEGVSALNR